MINATIQSKDGKTAVIDLSAHTHEMYEALSKPIREICMFLFGIQAVTTSLIPNPKWKNAWAVPCRWEDCKIYGCV